MSPGDRDLLKQILQTVQAARAGDFTLRAGQGEGLVGEIGEALNALIGNLKNTSQMHTEELFCEVMRANAELEVQAMELEVKARQLSRISRYKSEFLANMSHELRTPLNSLLILSKILAENKDKNLTPEQVKFAATAHSAGQDLLTLINEILDLSKVEAGKMSIELASMQLGEVREYLEQNFRPVAVDRGLEFTVEGAPDLPRTIYTDVNRVRQILKNLLSNAFKFTEKGKVDFAMRLESGRNFGIETLDRTEKVLALSVKDSGIGIPTEKQSIIFEAFQQADGTTSRRYGGTGLGLTISRELARLLGGAILVDSVPGAGSTFTLYLPQVYSGADAPQAS